MTTRSRSDLGRWATDLVLRRGLPADGGLHLLLWQHEGSCPLHPDSGDPEDPAQRCGCQPDLDLLLDVGTPAERRIALVVDGLPVRGAPVI